VSTYVASATKQLAAEARTSTVSYDVERASDIEPQYVLKRRIHENIRTLLSGTEKDVLSLLRWEEGWDGYDAPKPKRASIDAAYAWIRTLHRDVRNELWIEPLVTADEEGDVVFEWWRGRKKLTVYISPKTAEYVKVERRDTGTEMVDGTIGTPRERHELWNWLLS
jgi:hypothetical protein